MWNSVLGGENAKHFKFPNWTKWYPRTHRIPWDVGIFIPALRFPKKNHPMVVNIPIPWIILRVMIPDPGFFGGHLSNLYPILGHWSFHQFLKKLKFMAKDASIILLLRSPSWICIVKQRYPYHPCVVYQYTWLIVKVNVCKKHHTWIVWDMISLLYHFKWAWNKTQWLCYPPPQWHGDFLQQKTRPFSESRKPHMCIWEFPAHCPEYHGIPTPRPVKKHWKNERRTNPKFMGVWFNDSFPFQLKVISRFHLGDF